MLTMVPPDATSSVVPLVTALLLTLVPLETICVDTDLYPLNGSASSTRSKGRGKPLAHDNSMKGARNQYRIGLATISEIEGDAAPRHSTA
jgi:hypothetical protein